MSATPPELPGVRRKRILFWALGFCVVAVVGLLARAYVVGGRQLEARLALQHAKNVAEVEQVLGKPIEEWGRLDRIRPDFSQGIYTQADDESGYVLKRYLLWGGDISTLHPGYLTLVVKVRPTDGAVLAAKVVHE
jgi:hypothetical protein